MIHEYAAIDPMALLFPSRLYIELSEKLHPHVPKSIEIKEALGRLTPEHREAIIARVELGYTYEELAQALGKPSAEAARKTARRALLRLAEEMNRAAT
jgi:DNA-directed RNA polymerase specialized sigma24 family protein